MKKGYEESQKPGTVVVMLIPARTDTSYFHDYILHGKAAEIRFLRGRLKFTDEDGNAKDSAPFPSAVIVWRSPDMGQSLRDMVLDLIKGEPMTANEIAATLSDRGQQVNRSDVGPILTKAQAAGKIKNAGKRACNMNDEAREVICRRLDLPEIINGPATFPMGCILATAELVDCIRITSEFVATLSADELALGDYTLGRYAWKLANVQKLPEPIPAKGRQGLWNWEACLLLRHKGRDSWERPVYEDETGKLWKDVEPRADDGPKLCSALYNAFDGEPDTPLEVMERYKDKAIIFIPKRDTWTW